MFAHRSRADDGVVEIVRDQRTRDQLGSESSRIAAVVG